MRKNIWSCVLILSILVLVGTGPCVAAGQVFPDITDHWARDYITQLTALGYVGGYPDGTFKPDKTMSRAEFTSALITCMGVTASDATSRNFSDTSGNWALAAINEAVKRDILVPAEYPEGLVPDGGIKRSEACAMLVRALDKGPTGGSFSFTDNNDLEQSMYAGYVKTAVDMGIMVGYSDGSFKPFSTMTRSQAFTVLYKFLAQQGKVPAVPSTATTSTVTASTGTINYIAIGDNVYDCKQATFIINFQAVPVTSIIAAGSSITVNGYYTVKLNSSDNSDIVIDNNRYSFDKLTVNGDKLVLSSPCRKIYKFSVNNYTYNSDYINLYVNSADKGYFLSDLEIVNENKVKVDGKTYDLDTDKLAIAVNPGNSGTKKFYRITQIDMEEKDTVMDLEATDPVVLSDLSISDIAAIFDDDSTINLDKIDEINFIIDGEKYDLADVSIDASGNFKLENKYYTYGQVTMVIDDTRYAIESLCMRSSKYIFYCNEGSSQDWVIVDDKYLDAGEVKIVKGTTVYDCDDIIVAGRNKIRINGREYKLDSDFKCKVGNKVYAIDEISYSSAKGVTVIETGDLEDVTVASQPDEIIFFNNDSKYQQGTDDVTIYIGSKWVDFDKISITDASHYTYNSKIYDLIGGRIRIDDTEFEIEDTSWHGASAALDIYMDED